MRRHYCWSDQSSLQQSLWTGVLLLGMWVGAKCFYLLAWPYGKWPFFLQSWIFWLGGGLVFWGGLVGFLCTFFFILPGTFFKKYALLVQWIPYFCFFHSVGRVGCFLAGCCYGKYWSLSAFSFYRIPISLFESLYLLVLGLMFSKRLSWRTPLDYLTLYGLGRLLLEFWRGDEERGLMSLWGTTLSLAQWQSLGMLMVALILYPALRDLIFSKTSCSS
jgi:phosphatidylglycerol:prolipoprotein diacylglycerol transferase